MKLVNPSTQAALKLVKNKRPLQLVKTDMLFGLSVYIGQSRRRCNWSKQRHYSNYQLKLINTDGAAFWSEQTPIQWVNQNEHQVQLFGWIWSKIEAAAIGQNGDDFRII